MPRSKTPATREELDSLRATIEALTEAVARLAQGPKTRRARRSPMQEKAVAFLQAHPKADYRAFAAALYGTANAASLNAARVLVAKMRETKVITGNPGAWKVLRPNLGGGPM